MKFHFAFEKLRLYRKREEELAMSEFLQARQKFDAAVAQLKAFYQSIQDTRKLASDTRQSGGATGDALRQMDEFIIGQEVRIGRQKLEVRTLNQDMEEKHAVAVAKAQEFKMLDKLKEKQHTRFKQTMKKKELKEADDLVTMRFERRKSEGI